MESAIAILTSEAENRENNAVVHDATGDHDQAARDRRLADEYRRAARHLKAVQS